VQFKAYEFEALLNKSGIRHVYTAFYSPQTNGAERVNRSLMSAIRSYIIYPVSVLLQDQPYISQ